MSNNGGGWWAPKPLRPEASNPIFEVSEPETVVKSQGSYERQRAADGTPYDSNRTSAVRPPDTQLYISKGSMAEDIKHNRHDQPEADPQVYNSDSIARIVKAYLGI